MVEENVQPAAETSQKPKGSNKTTMIIIGVVILAILAGAGYYFYGRRSGVVITEDGKKVNYSTSNNGQNATISDENGSYTVGDSVKLASDFPSDIPVYPNLTYTSTYSEKDKSSYGYTATSKDSIAKISAWYKTEFAKKGWKIDLETPSSLSVSNDTMMGGLTMVEVDGVNTLSVAVGKKSDIYGSNTSDYDASVQAALDAQESLGSE